MDLIVEAEATPASVRANLERLRQRRPGLIGPRQRLRLALAVLNDVSLSEDARIAALLIDIAWRVRLDLHARLMVHRLAKTVAHQYLVPRDAGAPHFRFYLESMRHLQEEAVTIALAWQIADVRGAQHDGITGTLALPLDEEVNYRGEIARKFEAKHAPDRLIRTLWHEIERLSQSSVELVDRAESASTATCADPDEL